MALGEKAQVPKSNKLYRSNSSWIINVEQARRKTRSADKFFGETLRFCFLFERLSLLFHRYLLFGNLFDLSTLILHPVILSFALRIF